MMELYSQIRDHLSDIELHGIEDRLISPRETRQVEKISNDFRVLGSVKKSLQATETTIADWINFFGAVF